jgi:hypothetical protein
MRLGTKTDHDSNTAIDYYSHCRAFNLGMLLAEDKGVEK